MMKLIFNIKKQSVLLLCFIFLYNCGDTGKKNVNFKKYLDSLTSEIKDVIDSYPNKDYLKELVEKNNVEKFKKEIHHTCCFNVIRSYPNDEYLNFVDIPEKKTTNHYIKLNQSQKKLMIEKFKYLIYKTNNCEIKKLITKKYDKVKFLVHGYSRDSVNGGWAIKIKHIIINYIVGELKFKKN